MGSIFCQTPSSHILSDSYSFGDEYALKDIFKRCLNIGYVSKLMAIKGNTKRTKIEIARIIDSEKKINPDKEQEYTAVLYSVAVAVGSCTKNDYLERNQPHEDQTKKTILIRTTILNSIVLNIHFPILPV